MSSWTARASGQFTRLGAMASHFEFACKLGNSSVPWFPRYKMKTLLDPMIPARRNYELAHY